MRVGHEPHSLEYLPMYLESKGIFIHYTCNAPEEKILEKNGIEMLGLNFGCANRKEVLVIPEKIYLEKQRLTNNKDQLQLNLELLLKNLK